ncbi:MAG: hypothetical protein WBC90_13550 [Albidovulum sp.]|jgi:hypothetical protein
MRILVSTILAALLALPLHARPLTEANEASLIKAVDGYLRASAAANAQKVVATIPPRVINVFAGTSGVEAKKLEETLVAQTAELLKATKIRQFKSDQGPFDVQDVTLADGSVVTWVLVGTEFTAITKDKTTRNTQPLLAILEDKKWYFTRIDGPQQQQLVAFAYPFVADLTLPASTSTPVE